MAWAGGRTVASAPVATNTPAALVSEPKIPEPAPLPTAPPQLAPETEPRLPFRAQPLKPRVLLTAVLGTLIFVLGWTGVRALIAHRTPARGAAPAVAEVAVPAPSLFASAPAVPSVA